MLVHHLHYTTEQRATVPSGQCHPPEDGMARLQMAMTSAVLGEGATSAVLGEGALLGGKKVEIHLEL